MVFIILSVSSVYLQHQEYATVVIPQSYSECVEYVINPSDPKYVIQTIQSRCDFTYHFSK
jgi:DNA polymerase III delta prime subunit